MEPENDNPRVTADGEVIPEAGQALEAVAETVTQLATRGSEGKAIIKAREEIVDAAVKASIRLTHPSDWVLFRDKSGRITGFLQDSGCKRIDRIWGIQVTPKTLEKVESGGDYAYIRGGDAYCKLTDTWIHDVEGMRCSTERFVEQVTEPLLKDIRVRQAARANLDGNCIRRLSGLQNIPAEFLDEVWRGTGKVSAHCSQGKGFGTQQERQGTNVRSETTPNIQPPICESCNAELQYLAAGSNSSGKWDAYWKCREYKWDPKARQGNGHSRIAADEWAKTVAAMQKESAGAPAE
jgi:hypothetical protein